MTNMLSPSPGPGGRDDEFRLDEARHPGVNQSLFIHLSLDDITRMLRNFLASDARFLLVTYYTERRENADIDSGDFRPVSLCAPPFNFPPPILVINEESRQAEGLFPDRSMALWELSAFRELLAPS